MSSRSNLDSLLSALIDGWPFDLDAGESIKFLPAVNDRGFMQIGDGSTDMDLKIYLGGAGAYVLFDSGATKLTFYGVNIDTGAAGITTQDATVTGELSVTGAQTFVGNTELQGNTLYTGANLITGSNRLSSRYELKWTAGEHGKPGIPADAVENTTATYAVTDPLFEITGTNGTSALVTIDNTGGITMTTATTANDQMILGAHTTAGISGWYGTAWNTAKSPEWECSIKTGADIVNSVIWAGLKLTSDPTVATDDDQVFFRYDTKANSGAWLFVSSIANTDVSTNTGVALANSTAVHLKIVVNSARVARAYINGVLVHTTGALTANTDLLPFIGVQTSDAAAASLTVRGQAISKDY